MKHLSSFKTCAALALLSLASLAEAQITFVYDYSGNAPGVGFLDPVNGPARQAALTEAGNRFSTLFSSHFSNSATITLAVTSTDNVNIPVLASAGSQFIQASGTFGAGEVIRQKLITGTDINNASLDGYVDVNWGYTWELNPNTPAVGPGPGQTYDFFAALNHEFTHSLGFGSEITGTPGHDRFGQGQEGSGTQGSWSKWDQFLADSAGNSLINGSTFEVNQSAFSNAQANGGRFVGPNAMAAYNNSTIPLFANPDQSHLDEVTFSTPNVPENYMMKPERDYGPQEARFWHPVEVGILTDLGYAPVPAPSAIAVFVLGAIPGVGVLLRRRRKA